MYSPKEIKEARKLYSTGLFSQRELASRFGVCQQTIARWASDEFRQRNNEWQRKKMATLAKNPRRRLQMRQKARGRQRKHAPDPRSLTYAIRHKNLVKIGTAVDLQHRFNALQGSSPVPLQLLGVLPFNEYALHDKFDHCRQHGEWFKLTPKLRQFLKQHLRKL